MTGSPPEAVTVVLPTYNEVATLERVVRAVTAHGYRVLVVDDGSPDGTGDLADRLANDLDSVSVLHRASKGGLGPAYVAGFEVALARNAQVIGLMDSDLSHDPSRLPVMLAAIHNGADLVVGSRLVPGGGVADWALWRRLLSRWGNRYARLMLGTNVRDMTSGYRLITAEALQRIDPEAFRSNGYAFQLETVLRAHRLGMTITEVPIVFTEREAGISKMGLRIVIEAMWLVTGWGLTRMLRRLRPPDRVRDR
jgi:dolichol-phosphate mannosyltransferase